MPSCIIIIIIRNVFYVGVVVFLGRAGKGGLGCGGKFEFDGGVMEVKKNDSSAAYI